MININTLLLNINLKKITFNFHFGFLGTSSSSTIHFTETSTVKRKFTKNYKNINKFAIKTSSTNLDLQIARFIYGTNSSFRVVEHPEFKKLINMLRLGYNLPTRQTITGNLLDSVYNMLQNNLKEQLAGKIVCMALDGWSNVHNDSIICVCVTEISSGNVHLIATIDTLDNSHTWDYLTSLVVNSIKSCEQFGCTVGSLVTDNSTNMHRMTSNLATHNDFSIDIITYCCSAHLLNLLA